MALNVSGDPNYWQNRDEEAWSLAVEMGDAHTKAIMVGIAQSYEKIDKWVQERPREHGKSKSLCTPLYVVPVRPQS